MSIERRRIVFLGTRGEFTLTAFRALLAARTGLTIAALVVPRAGGSANWLEPPSPPSTDLPLIPSPVAPNAVNLAIAAGIPVLEVGSLSDPQALSALDSLAPDLICAACFPRLLPASWLARPRLGCLNLHPSLLPAYRGPAPLFWQFRSGEARTGATVHFMDENADTGDIAAQAEVRFADGITSADADRLTAEAGARRLIDSLALPSLPRRPQPRTGVSYQPYPTAADRVIPTTWSARRAFNFIRGANEWRPFEIAAGGEKFSVGDAKSFEPDAPLGAPYVRRGGELWIQFSPGVLEAVAI